MLLRWLIILCYCTLFATPSFATQIDSLEQILRTTNNPEKKVDVLITLSHKMLYLYPNKQFNYANDAYEIFHNSNITNDSLLAEVLYALGSANEVLEEDDVALELFKQAKHIAQQLSLEELQFAIFNNEGMLYDKISAFDLSIESYQKALRIAEKNNDNEGISASANNIAILFTRLKEYEKAKELLQKSYDYSVLEKDEHGKAIALSNIGDIYFEQKKWDKALDYFNQALVIVDSMGLNYGISLTHLHLGLTYQRKGQLEIAQKYCQKAYQMAKEFGFKENLGESALGLAEIKFSEGDYLNSIAMLKEVLVLTSQFSSKITTVNTYKCLSENYAAMGQFKEALAYRQQYEIEQDSLFDEERITKFSALEYQFNTQKKEAENALLKAEQLKKDAIIEQRTLIAWSIGSALLLFGLSTWVLFFQNKQKHYCNQQLEIQVVERTEHLQVTNEKLSTANQELEQFAYITSHDLKEPLRNISGFSSLIQRNIRRKKYENLDEYFSFINQNTRQMHALIEDILSFSKVGQSSEGQKTSSLAMIMENAKNDLHLLIKEKNGQIVYNDPKLFDKSANILLPFQVSMVFKNLIENGLKYNKSETPTIKIAYQINDDFHVFNFYDNGIGIEKPYHDKVFEMFKRLHNRGEYSGSGVGLAICRKVAQNIKGQLTIVQSNEPGTVFELKIPVKMEAVATA